MIGWMPEFSAEDAVLEKDRCLFHGFFRMYELTITHATFKGDTLTVKR